MTTTRIEVDLAKLRDDIAIAIDEGATKTFGLVHPSAAARIALKVLEGHVDAEENAITHLEALLANRRARRP